METNAQQKFFELTSSPYSSLFSGRISAASYSFSRRLAIASNFTRGRGGVLLDCAVGSGEVALACAQSGSFHNVILNDFSPAMLELANNRFSAGFNFECIWHQEDCFNLLRERSSGSVDVLLCLGLVAHTGRLDELLVLLSRALSPEGVLIFQSTLSNHWGIRLQRLLTSKRYKERHGYSISYQSESDVLESALNAGLVLQSIDRFCVFLPGLDKVSRRLGYYSELLLEPLSSYLGSEALFVFSPK